MSTLELARRAVSRLNHQKEIKSLLSPVKPPRFDISELYGIVGTDLKNPLMSKK